MSDIRRIVMLRLLLQKQNMSLYRLEKLSSISHASLSDLYNEKSDIKNCSVELLHKISNAMKISMDVLYDYLSYKNLDLVTYDSDFDLFKSSVCQELKYLGDLEFLNKYKSSDEIEKLYHDSKIPQAVYLLCVLDYICDKHMLPYTLKYQHIRKITLNKLYVSKGIYLLLKFKDISITQIFYDSLDVFLRHNIAEGDIDNVY